MCLHPSLQTVNIKNLRRAFESHLKFTQGTVLTIKSTQGSALVYYDGIGGI